MKRTYPAYKDSGMEWLGEIPRHWEAKRLRFTIKTNPMKSEIRGLNNLDLVSFVPMEAVGEYGGLALVAEKALEEVSSGYTYFQDGDVVVAKITPCFENGKGAIAKGLTNGIGFGTTELHVLRPKSDIDGRYLFYLSISHPFRKLGESEMYGAGGQKRVPEDYIRNLRPSIPPLAEQKSIASFLDRKTTEIDALIAKKRRMIELLQEKRTAVISHAVTKGLDPNAPMKDSGVEWLGKVPRHWEVLKLKRLSKRIQTGSTPPTLESRYYEGGTVPWYGPGSFTQNLVLTEPVKYIAEEAIKDGVARLFSAGSTLIVTIGATIGKVGYLDAPASSNQQITAVAVDARQCNSKFIAYQIKSLEPILRGIAQSATLPIMDQEEVGILHIALPPMNEQKAIIAFIDSETQKIDSLITKILEAIGKLLEYRTALISAAVTGKIDVRNEVGA